MIVVIKNSTNPEKKYMAIIDGKKTVHFGARGYSDYTIHHDPERKERYIARHQAREDWTIWGIKTAGFWSRWLLWNLPSLSDSIHDIERRFGIHIEIE